MYVIHHTYLLEDCSLCLLYHLDCCFVVGFQPHVRLIIGLTVWLRLWNLSHIFRLVSLIISFTWSHKHYTYCGELNDSGFTMYFWLIAFVIRKIFFFTTLFTRMKRDVIFIAETFIIIKAIGIVIISFWLLFNFYLAALQPTSAFYWKDSLIHRM